MIDWYSGLIGYDGSELRPNLICKLTPDGEVVWTTNEWMQAEGSYSATVRVGVAAPAERMTAAADRHGLLCSSACLRVSGNPSKYLQGHNVIGPSVSNLGPVLRALVRAFPDGVRPRDADSDLWPAVQRSRVDLTTTVDLGDHALVHEFVRAASLSTRTRHGQAMASGTTVYYGKHSRRWSLKAYCKLCELKAHPPKLPGQELQPLVDWSEGKLRLELTLRGPELAKYGTLSEGLIWSYMDRIEGGIMANGDNVERVRANLPRAAESTLLRWQSGERVELKLPKATFYRHRRQILDGLGVDISTDCYTGEKRTRQVLDTDYLKAHECAEVPEGLQGYLFNVEGGPVRPRR